MSERADAQSDTQTAFVLIVALSTSTHVQRVTMTSVLDDGIDSLDATSEQQHQQHHQQQHEPQATAVDDTSEAHVSSPADGHVSYFPPQHSQLFSLPQQLQQSQQQQQMAFELQQHQQQQQHQQAQSAYLHHLAMQQQQQHHFQQQHQQPQLSQLAGLRLGHPQSQQQLPPPCRLFAGGYCRFGDQCRYSHSAPLNHSLSQLSSGASSTLPAIPPPPPPGLDGTAYQHQPHIHAALMQQQMDALRQQQANMQYSHHALSSGNGTHSGSSSLHRTQFQQPPLPLARQTVLEQHRDDSNSGERAEDADTEDKDRQAAVNGSNSHEEQDKRAAAGEDDSEAASTPRSTAPSSIATTYLSSSNSSPSALSANATPFSSSFSSPSFPPSSAASSQHHSPFLNPAYPAMQPGKLSSQHTQYPFHHFSTGPSTAGMDHTLTRQQPFPFNRHTAPFVPSHGQSPAFAYSAHQRREIESRDPEREAELFSSMGVGVNFDKYDDIAVDAQGNGVQPPVAAFTDLPLPEFLQHNIDAAHYVKPTPIQKHALPNALMGRDIMACAQTGSGQLAVQHAVPQTLPFVSRHCAYSSFTAASVLCGV